jgi:membrane dipeptidase
MTWEYPISERAARLHRDAIVFDGHCDTLMDMTSGARPFAQSEGAGHVDLPRLVAGGMTGQIFAAYVGGKLGHRAAVETLRMIETMHEAIESWPEQICLATCAEQVRQAKRQGKIAGILSMEGAEGLLGDLKLLRAFYRLGVRNLGLTHNGRNEAADGVAEAGTGGGLTEFGVALLQEMRRLGIMVDIAHLSPAGVAQVFELYDGPVVDSHANAAALCGHRRNLSNAQLEQLAHSGGVVGVVFLPHFISDEPEKASLERLLDHIDHIAHVAGIDHVGFGSDWDGFGAPAAEFPQDVSGMPMITEGLVRRGYSDDEIRKVLGENWLRVFGQVAG